MTFFGDKKILIAKFILFQWFSHSIKNLIANCCQIMDFELRFWDKNLKPLPFTPKFLLKAPLTKFQFLCGLHDISLKKNSEPFEFRKMEGRTGILNKHVF